MYRKRLVFWTACMGMLVFGIALITLGSIAPELKEKLNLDEISSGTLFAILPFGILTGSLFFGPFVDKNGYRIILAASCMIMFAGFEGIAFAQSKGLIKIWIFLVGFGGGIINGATNAVVSDISEDARSANISLLGVFFGVGALGMPLILGILKDTFSFETVVSAVGIITLAIGVIYLFTGFPPPKQIQGFPLVQSKSLFSDKVLLLIAIFLFFQSSFEGIINNWTTTYLTDHLSFRQNKALFALSAYVAGMSLMRLIIGTLFRSVPVKRIMGLSFLLLLSGSVLLKTGISFNSVLAGMVMIGAGLAAGFPVMLSFVGDRYTDLSGTAFSFVLFIALTGNILFNYGMGIISRNFGIRYLVTVALAESVILITLFFLIIQRINHK